MRVQVLTVPDCPHGPLLIERLTQARAGRRGVEVEHRVVADEEQAARLGMHGSPTLLLDGRDPFAAPDTPASLSCRLYRDADGRADGAPSLKDLRQALDAAAGLAGLAGPAGRGGRGRRAPAVRGLRAAQQAVLRSFATTAAPPRSDDLERVAAPFGVTAAQVVAELAAEDFVGADDDGRITHAYPFSTVPTDHAVQIDGGPQVWAMCAIDALGIPAMLGGDVVITSTDPVTGTPIRVEFRGGAASWHPASAVVYYGTCEQAGPAAVVCCGYLRFFTDRVSADTWVAQWPEVCGGVLEQAQAERLGAEIFGPLLTE